MKYKEISKELLIVIFAVIILAVSISLFEFLLFNSALICFLIIIGTNVLAKKIYGYYIETNVRIKFWSWYQWWFTQESHFNTPLPMVWLPPIISFISKGYVWWLGILEFDVEAKTERVSKRHGLYRYTEVTEWHIALIAMVGIITNLVLAILGYVSGFETLAKLSIVYAFWSIIPIGNMDGTKILFGQKKLWMTLFIIILIILVYGIMVV